MDLTKQPPRCPSNLCMANLVNLARMTDKARASNDGTLGEYVYGTESGLDETLLEFLGISADDFADAAGRYNDEEIAEWVRKVSDVTDAQIETFNRDLLSREPQAEDAVQRLKNRVAKYAPGRADIKTVMQSIELEDWGDYKDVDLTQRAPRTPYCRDVAGIYGMARMSDKARADKAGTRGEYNYNCPIDQIILGFLGMTSEDFQEAAYQNPNDLELGAWVMDHTEVTREDIAAFNAHISASGPETDEQQEYFQKALEEVAPGRTGIRVWFDLMDLDDEKSFHTVDLVRHAPRSPYDKGVGGIYGVARMIDKGRAFLDGAVGDYWSGKASGIDRLILKFLGVSVDNFYAALKDCATDADVLARLESKGKKTEAEIAEFNGAISKLAPGDDKTWAYFRGRLAELDPARTDIVTWFGLMHLGDRIFFARLKAGV